MSGEDIVGIASRAKGVERKTRLALPEQRDLSQVSTEDVDGALAQSIPKDRDLLSLTLRQPA